MQNLKAPPHNIDSEILVLGSMLMRPETSIPVVKNALLPSDFYRKAHQSICQACFDLRTDTDLQSVCVWLEKKELLKKSGGQDYVISLVEQVSVSVGLKWHIDLLKDLSRRRQLIGLCSESAAAAYLMSEQTEEVLSTHKSGIRTIEGQQNIIFSDNASLVNAVFKDAEDRAKSGNRFVGVKTGFDNLDINLQGLEPKTTNYLIARPSMGKTALALNIADSVALNNPGKVLFFSLESGDVALTRRRLSARSGVFLTRLRTGDIEDSQWPDLIEAANVLSEDNLLIIDKPKYKTVENLVTLTETLAMETEISLIVIDHIQRMRSKKKHNNRHLELSYVSEELSSLSSDLNTPALILCQLSREVEKRKDQHPRLSDMKESGDLEQNADSVIGLYRVDKTSEFARIEGLKGRDTGTWTTWLKFDRYIQKFYDCEEQYESPVTRNGGFEE